MVRQHSCGGRMVRDHDLIQRSTFKRWIVFKCDKCSHEAKQATRTPSGPARMPHDNYLANNRIKYVP